MQDAIGILVQAGAVGICLALCYVVYKQNDNATNMNTLLADTLTKIADQHQATIDRNTEAWKENTQMLARINERIK
jgi:hypothetical protein